MKKTAILIMFVTIISKIFGFIKDIVLSYYYGVSNISDAYVISMTIPTVIFSFIGSAIYTGYIPIFNEIKNKYCRTEANRYTNNLINIILILCTLILIVGLVFTNQIVRLFASGFEGETLILAIAFTRIGLFGIYFMGIMYILNGFLQSNGSFIIPASVSLIFNILIIISIVLSSYRSLFILPIGSLLASAIQIIPLLIFAIFKGFKYELVIDFKDEYIKKMLRIVFPIILGVSVSQINVLVDRTIASRIAIGAISALDYSNKINLFIQGIFVMSIITILYPAMSKMVAENKISDLNKSISESVTIVNLLVVPATIGIMIFSRPIVSMLFERGTFGKQAVDMTSNALFFYSIGMLGVGLREVFSRIFYAFQDTKTPMKNGAIGMVVNIVLNIILSRFLGVGGLALATSISATLTTILMIISLRKKIGPFGIKKISKTLLKILSASFLMGFISKLTFEHLSLTTELNASLLISILIAIIIYAIAIYFMKIEEVDTIYEIINSKLKRVSNAK